MKYQTELMKSIITSEKAKKMINYSPPVYGKSYVGLWLFQVIGDMWDDIYNIFADLRNETNPAMADRLIGMWEDSYGIPRNSSLTLEQRRKRIIEWRDRGPCNPHRLAAAVSTSLNGVGVDIQENIAKNTFLVNIREVVYDWSPAEAVLDRKKPAHLIYKIRVCTQVVAEPKIKVAVGITRSKKYVVNVAGTSMVAPIYPSAVPLSNPEIDTVHDDVMENDTVYAGEIPYVEADETRLANEEVDAIHDNVF